MAGIILTSMYRRRECEASSPVEKVEIPWINNDVQMSKRQILSRAVVFHRNISHGYHQIYVGQLENAEENTQKKLNYLT